MCAPSALYRPTRSRCTDCRLSSRYARGGRHVEFGVAVASGKRLIVIGYRENVFRWLAQVAFYDGWEDFLRRLTN
jgi:hypothetical protein